MTYVVLGALEVNADGQARTLRGQRSRDLLAALLLRAGQTVDPSLLLSQVWGEGSGLGAAVVHTQVARIRRDLGSTCIETLESGYRIAEAETDAHVFADLVQRARIAAPGEAIDLLREGLALWRGDEPYAGVTPDLVAAESVRLLGLRGTARELLAERLLGRGDRPAVEEAAELAELLLNEDPLRERGHELGIEAAARSGRRAEALERFDRLRRCLRDELGIDPGPAARELHLRVLRDEVGRAAPAPPEAGSRPGAPVPTTRTIGREEDLDHLQRLLRDRRLVTLVGLGGVGKSRLLAELAVTLGDRMGGYVDLAGLPEPPGEELAEAVGEALGVNVRFPDPIASLAAGIGDRDAVLLADEAERCSTDVAELVGVLLGRCPGLRVVATSRTPLGLVGEAVHVVDPLPTPAVGAGRAAVAESPAVILLRERIADRAPTLVQGELALQRLADFTRQVDGLPLALLLLAAQAPGRSLDELSELLDAPAQLGADVAGLAERHRSLAETIGWSLDRLPADQQRALARLSVFAGPFGGPAARAVVGTDVDADGALHALVRDALVQVERGRDELVFRLLRPVRDLAHQRLLELGELEVVARRHRRWHAERWRQALRSDALLADVRAHYADYVEALRSAHDARDHEQVTDLSMTLGRLWSFTDALGPGLRWFGRALEADFLAPLERAQIKRMRAALQVAHAPESSRRDIEEALPVFAAHDSAIDLAGAHLALALERYTRGHWAEAADHAAQAVVAGRQTTEERLADTLGMQALVLAVTDPAGAEVAAREAWAIVTRSGSAAAVASVACNLACFHLTLHRPELADELLDRAVAGLAPYDVPAFLHQHRAWTLLAVGELAAALAEFDDVVAMSQDALEGVGLAEVYAGAACAVAGLRLAAAAELVAGADAMLTRTGLVLAPWQAELLDTARERASRAGPAPWGADTVSGTGLAALVRTLAARVAAGTAERTPTRA